VVEAAGGKVRVRRGSAEHTDAVLTGDPYPMLGLLSGVIDLEAARAMGVELEGDPAVVARLLPAGPALEWP
jgi:hypothetical protein